MNRSGNFQRKVTYGALIAVLLFPLSRLSAPATVESPGGTLAQMRTENGLSQANLGEVDPASETIKLATLGLRGLAVNLLWEKANHYKKVEDWTNLTATLEQLAKLQPNFITFWKFQSWNLSYNVSVEFDDYHDRYYWVRRGIQFLEEGNKYNVNSPVLLWELGWVLGQKIGRSDEKIQYRRLFKADDEYHPEDRQQADRDNWLVSKDAYLDSIASVDEVGKSLGKKSPVVFYSSPAKSQMSYSEAIGNEGLFETAVRAWAKAEKEWIDFGQQPIEHSTGVWLQLGDEAELEQRVEELDQQLRSLLEGVEEKVVARLREGLSDEFREALETPEDQRDDNRMQLAYEAERQLRVTPDELARQIAMEIPEKQLQAEQLASDLRDADRQRRYTDNYKDTANYDYWLLRSQFEQSGAAVAARELVHRAERQFREEGNPVEAKRLYEESFDRWAEVFEQFPDLMDPDGTTGDDVMVFIYDYNRVLEQLDEEMPEDFPLWDVIREFDVEQEFAIPLRQRAASEEEAASAD